MSMGRTMEAIVWAMSARGISAGAWKLLVMLAKRVGTRNFEVWPSHRTLAEQAEMSVSTVRRHLGELEAEGYLKILPRYDDAGDRTSNAYQLQVRVKIVTPVETTEIEPDYEADDGADEGGVDLEGGPFKLNRPSVQNEGTGLFTGEQAEEIPDGRNSSLRTPPSPDGEDPPQTEFKLVGEEAPQPPAEPLHAMVERHWQELKARHPGIAGIRKVDDKLAKAIAARGREHARAGEDGFAVWQAVFAAIERSPWLQGRAPPGRGYDKPFRLSLGWLTGPTNFREVINGRHDGDTDRGRIDPDTGRRLGPTDQASRGTVARLRAARGRAAGQRGGVSHLRITDR